MPLAAETVRRKKLLYAREGSSTMKKCDYLLGTLSAMI